MAIPPNLPSPPPSPPPYTKDEIKMEEQETGTVARVMVTTAQGKKMEITLEYNQKNVTKEKAETDLAQTIGKMVMLALLYDIGGKSKKLTLENNTLTREYTETTKTTKTYDLSKGDYFQNKFNEKIRIYNQLLPKMKSGEELSEEDKLKINKLKIKIPLLQKTMDLFNIQLGGPQQQSSQPQSQSQTLAPISTIAQASPSPLQNTSSPNSPPQPSSNQQLNNPLQ